MLLVANTRRLRIGHTVSWAGTDGYADSLFHNFLRWNEPILHLLHVALRREDGGKYLPSSADRGVEQVVI